MDEVCARGKRVHPGELAMLAYPKVTLSLDRLRRGDWAMGDLCVERPEGRIWIVTGQRRKHWIIAQAPSQAAAWFLAWEQADKLARPRRRRNSESLQ